MRLRLVAAFLSIAVTTAAASAEQRAGPSDAAQAPATITERTYIGGGLLPSRTVQRRTESAGRQIVVDTEERLGADGRWEPVEEIVTETLRMGVAVQTRRQVFGFDVERRRTLMETTETEETLDRDIVRVVEETRIPDIKGGSGPCVPVDRGAKDCRTQRAADRRHLVQAQRQWPSPGDRADDPHRTAD